MPNKTTKPIPQVFAQRTSPAPASRKLRINSLRSSRASIVFFEIQTDLALVRRAEKLFQPQKYSSPALPWFGLLSVQFFLCAFLGHENGALSHGKKTERHTAHTQSSNFQTVLHRDVISSVLHLAIFCDFSGKRYKCTRGGKIQKNKKEKRCTPSHLFSCLSCLPFFQNKNIAWEILGGLYAPKWPSSSLGAEASSSASWASSRAKHEEKLRRFDKL